jgi:hypothetical protein
MKSLTEYVNERINEASDMVYAVQDNTGVILNVFDEEEDARADLANWPTYPGVKVVSIKRSDVED